MTAIQEKMQALISKEELERAFDARFPREMKEKFSNGSNIAVMLARSGIGHLLLVDFDTVDVTNLNRQMYMTPHLGRPKAEALPDILCQINPYLEYESVCVKVTPENVKQLFEMYPIVCEAFDTRSESHAGKRTFRTMSGDNGRFRKWNGRSGRYQ